MKGFDKLALKGSKKHIFLLTLTEKMPANVYGNSGELKQMYVNGADTFQQQKS